jgi:hypothetical protein
MLNWLVITTTYHKAKPDAKPDGICINALAGEAGAGQIFCAAAS